MDEDSKISLAMVVGACLAAVFFAFLSIGQERRVYDRGLCNGHGGVQVEIADTTACVEPPTAVRIDHAEH